jgi:hypothetical protein
MKYTIEIEGDFITFVDEEGNRRAYKKPTIKEVLTNTGNYFLTLVSIDNNTSSYNYEDIENPVFADLNEFKDYIITELSS